MDRLAIYLRLSLEDADDKDESNSISSQRILLLDYIRNNRELEGKEVSEFCDDGYSGTSMERPGMQRLLKEIRENKIRCVLVKDMSRFSRDYIELGTYMNQIFPFMGVRFIAVNDHYDSRDHAGSTTPIETAFQTLLYDLYSKDISVKVKTSVENKCVNGEYVFGQVPFGYEKSRKIKIWSW
ncbi:recombinase family protein [Parablautia muri]|uniref:recombinase family protein n=1 Tax=Parablautia muri TaxID=2320879 RepID=UPI0024129FD0|nr:recombinase family protein [Parablautia muri]